MTTTTQHATPCVMMRSVKNGSVRIMRGIDSVFDSNLDRVIYSNRFSIQAYNGTVWIEIFATSDRKTAISCLETSIRALSTCVNR